MQTEIPVYQAFLANSVERKLVKSRSRLVTCFGILISFLSNEMNEPIS
jgi:hypothetical protein